MCVHECAHLHMFVCVLKLQEVEQQLSNKPQTSARAVSALNNRASSPDPILNIFRDLELHVSEGAGRVSAGWQTNLCIEDILAVFMST